MRKPSPFSGLKLTDEVGLDQRLFSAQSSSEPSKQRNNDTTEIPKNGTTPIRDNEPTRPRDNEGTSKLGSDGSRQRKHGQSNQRLKLQGGGLTGRFSILGQRLVERHSHDIFHDQVLWMNRIKLELEEQYGRRVTSNAIVQLAIDRLQRDFEAEGHPFEITNTLIEGIKSLTAGELRQGGGGSA